MSPRNEELLYFLLWTVDPLLRPGWRSMTESHETWAWRHGLTRRLAELERQKLIERHPEPSLERVVRLTQEGRRLALGGRDPVKRWSRPWDGIWRMILFDVPLPQSGLRQQFRRILRRSHFGYLQGSVWVTPDPADGIREILRETKIQADVLLIVEGRPAAGETDADIVSVAWDFDALHRRYKRYLEFLSSPLPRSARLPEWTQQEIIAWDYASQADPLLPQALVPPNYLGFEAHRRRKQLIAQLAVLTTTRSEQFHVAPAT